MYGANITSLRCNWPIPFFNDTLTWVWVYQTHQSQWLFISFHLWLQGIWAQFIDHFIHFAMKFMETYSNEFVIGNVRIKWTWTHVVDQVEVYGLYTYVIHMFDFFSGEFSHCGNKTKCGVIHTKVFCWEKMASSCHILRKNNLICDI